MEQMDFLAATKDGILVFDALSLAKNGDEGGNWKTGKTADGSVLKVRAKIPSPDNAFGHCWSADGDMLGSVCDEGVRIYDCSNDYATILTLPRVAPDVGGRTGGVRNMTFSPLGNYLVAYEKWDPGFPENVHVWALKGERKGKKLFSCTLNHYTSGALPVEIIKWTPDEATVIELVPGQGLLLRSNIEDEEPSRVIPEKSCGNFVLSPMTAKGACYAIAYTPESAAGMVGKLSIHNITEAEKKASFETHLPGKVKDARMLWNFDGSAALVLANSDVDETGCSYFGTTYMFWMKPDSKAPVQIYGSKDGQVQDLAWSPVANEFLVIVGFQPATVALHDGKNGKLISELGKSRRNTLKWNEFGRFVAVGGFGTLAGDLDFFDRSKEETISSLRAPLTVDCAFGPDGRHFLSCTVAPRMNEGNQISMYRYSGELLFRMDFVPDVVEARHEDTGAGARTKTQALLFASTWRPSGSRKWEDRPASPPRNGTRRKKGLPDNSASTTGPPVAAYRPRGAGNEGSSVALMMRGELAAPPASGWGDSDSKAPTLAPMEDWEIRKMQRQAQKDAELKEKQEKEAEIQARKDFEKDEKNDKKKLKGLKEKLVELEALKDKEWDELTEEDEAQLEGEVELRAQIVELEKKVKAAA